MIEYKRTVKTAKCNRIDINNCVMELGVLAPSAHAATQRGLDRFALEWGIKLGAPSTATIERIQTLLPVASARDLSYSKEPKAYLVRFRITWR